MENRDETVSLISAGKVQGTNVYNTDGDSLGEVYDVMIDKVSGKVAYAIMSFGGFLGVGERYIRCRGTTSNTTLARAVT
jgi:uncharacterized protein YrrD